MLSLTNITVHFGQRTLFEHIDLFIGQRERVGLVGRNGAGKSRYGARKNPVRFLQ